MSNGSSDWEAEYVKLVTERDNYKKVLEAIANSNSSDGDKKIAQFVLEQHKND